MEQPYASIEEKLAQIKEANSSDQKKTILIIGAGIAGLVTAYELGNLGHEVCVLEGSGRLGGRVFTHHFSNGQYGELGAMRVPKSHDYTRHYINRLGLKMRPFIIEDKNQNNKLDLFGTVSSIKDSYEKIFSNLSLNPVEKKLIETDGIGAIYYHSVKRLLEQLSEEDIRHVFDLNAQKDAVSYLDKMSFLEHMHQEGLSDDAIKLIGSYISMNDYWHKNMINFVVDDILDAFNGLEEIVGGTSMLPLLLSMQVLPDGKQLKDKIYFNTEVTAINNREDSVQLILKKNGKLYQRNFDQVVCTVPFSVLRGIHLNGNISQEKKEAIYNMGYHSSTKLLLNCKKRFWESEDEIFGGASFSDLIYRQLYYPSDNASYKSSMISKGPGVLLASYTWEESARRLASFPLKDRTNIVVDKIKRIHPNIGDFIDVDEPSASMVWDQYKWSSGAFATHNPREVSSVFPVAKSPEGRLFFAGEHLSPFRGWMQGAIYSALDTCCELLRK